MFLDFGSHRYSGFENLLTRLYGFEKVTVRLPASELNCSTQPVFHTFRNMKELKTEVYKKAKKFFEETMLQPPSDIEPEEIKQLLTQALEEIVYPLFCSPTKKNE